jgi:hypothetical protein
METQIIVNVGERKNVRKAEKPSVPAIGESDYPFKLWPLVSVVRCPVVLGPWSAELLHRAMFLNFSFSISSAQPPQRHRRRIAFGGELIIRELNFS